MKEVFVTFNQQDIPVINNKINPIIKNNQLSYLLLCLVLIITIIYFCVLFSSNKYYIIKLVHQYVNDLLAYDLYASGEEYQNFRRITNYVLLCLMVIITIIALRVLFCSNRK